MTASDQERRVVGDIIGRAHGAAPERLRITRRLLRGGLEAAGVERITARYRDREGRERVLRVVAKRLLGATSREAAVYERFTAPHAAALSPRLLAVDRAGPEQVVLYIEALRPTSAWPWGERHAAQRVLQRAAQLHTGDTGRDALAAIGAWDYERELRHAATLTLERLEDVRRQPALWTFGGALRWTRRIVGALPGLRRQLLASEPFGTTVIHGDLHPGNVVLRRERGADDPVLLDWGRARLGSPLEDVSCWLQSLGTWEPEARRRHDTLLSGYLRAHGTGRRLDAELRATYWLAGASNALSGALTYHLSVLLDARLPGATRTRAAHSAREWVRVLRQAAAYWC